MIVPKRKRVNIKNREVWDKTDGRCWYCGVRLVKPSPDHHTPEERKRWYTIDHATPRSRGGSLGVENLLPCCNVCNGDKCDMTVEEYRTYLTMRRNNVPYFSRTQMEYLTTLGVDILKGLTHVFYGETIVKETQ